MLRHHGTGAARVWLVYFSLLGSRGADDAGGSVCGVLGLDSVVDFLLSPRLAPTSGGRV